MIPIKKSNYHIEYRLKSTHFSKIRLFMKNASSNQPREFTIRIVLAFQRKTHKF